MKLRKRRRQQELQIARKPLHSISYLNKKIIDNHYKGWSTPFLLFLLQGDDCWLWQDPHEQLWDSEGTFLGFERNFEWSKIAWIFHPHRVTSYFWLVHNPSQISPKRIHEFLRTNKLHDVSKVEIGDLNIGDSIQIGHLVAGMLHCVLFFSLIGPVWTVHNHPTGRYCRFGCPGFFRFGLVVFFRSFGTENHFVLLSQ